MTDIEMGLESLDTKMDMVIKVSFYRNVEYSFI